MQSVAQKLSSSVLHFPSKVFVGHKLPEKLSVSGSLAINAIKKHLSRDLKNESATVLDACPGDGALSSELLNAGLPRIHILDKGRVEQYTDVEQLQSTTERSAISKLKSDFGEGAISKLKSDFGDRVTVHDSSVFPFEDENLSEVITKIAPCESWGEEAPLKVIIPLSPLKEHRMLNIFLHQFVEQGGLFTCTRPEVYLFISYYQAGSIAADYRARNYRSYRARSVLFQTLFDTEFLEKIPWESLTPVITRKKIKTKSDDFFQDYDNSFLLRLTPKKHLPHVIPIESLPEFHFFVTQSMVRRTNYLIPYFEKWFPGCGPRLIKAGIPLFAKAGDISPQTYVELFNLITKWPEYSTSTFKAASIGGHQMLSYDESEDDALITPSNPSESEQLQA